MEVRECHRSILIHRVLHVLIGARRCKTCLRCLLLLHHIVIERVPRHHLLVRLSPLDVHVRELVGEQVRLLRLRLLLEAGESVVGVLVTEECLVDGLPLGRPTVVVLPVDLEPVELTR